MDLITYNHETTVANLVHYWVGLPIIFCLNSMNWSFPRQASWLHWFIHCCLLILCHISVFPSQVSRLLPTTWSGPRTTRLHESWLQRFGMERRMEAHITSSWFLWTRFVHLSAAKLEPHSPPLHVVPCCVLLQQHVGPSIYTVKAKSFHFQLDRQCLANSGATQQAEHITVPCMPLLRSQQHCRLSSELWVNVWLTALFHCPWAFQSWPQMFIGTPLCLNII